MNKDLHGVVYVASILSISISIYLFVTGKRDTGIFIGLWAPTFLGLGTFYNSSIEAAKDEVKLLPQG
jgi:hypothetical protein